MTDFNDLDVQQKDFGAYSFALGAGLWTLDRLINFFSQQRLSRASGT
jgi:hypothetical protein